MEALSLDATGTVPHWPANRAQIPLHLALVHLATETHRHARHMNILRESVDGSAGHRSGSSNLPEGDAACWQAHVDHFHTIADR